VRLILTLFLLFLLSSCQLFPTRKGKPAEVTDAANGTSVVADDTEKSVLETVPLMNPATQNLYRLALGSWQQQNFNQALTKLQRAYEIQPNSPQITQLMSEIYLQQGDYKQSHYWATIATKNGPSKGKICSKSWQILALSAEKLGYFANQTLALNQQEKCLVKQQNRF
jgi:predicted Zn-dependent protease